MKCFCCEIDLTGKGYYDYNGYYQGIKVCDECIELFKKIENKIKKERETTLL